MKDLNNRVALVTGGSRGIGAAVAVALARAGAHVAVNYRERADAANAVCGEITGTGRKAIAIQADVSVSDDVRRMVAQIEAHLGCIRQRSPIFTYIQMLTLRFGMLALTASMVQNGRKAVGTDDIDLK
jgi:NAD(P)-dependent dehydrogenase (short-subunit alcohol dehydrogenase family)